MSFFQEVDMDIRSGFWFSLCLALMIPGCAMEITDEHPDPYPEDQIRFSPSL